MRKMVTGMESLKADDIRAQLPSKLVDRLLEAGYRAWLKRQVSRKSLTRTKKVNEKLQQMPKSELKRVITQITK